MKGATAKSLIKKYNLKEIEEKYFISYAEKRSWEAWKKDLNRRFEAYNNVHFLSYFDELNKDGLPEIDEYVDYVMMLTFEQFKKDLCLKDKEEALARKLIAFRTARSWTSRLIEEYLIEYLKWCGYEVYDDSLIDYVFGVDLIVKDFDNSFKYIHVTTTYDLDIKERKQWFKIKDKWFKYARDFKGDIIVNVRDDEIIGRTYNDWRLPTLKTLKPLFSKGNLSNGKLINFKHELELANEGKETVEYIESNILCNT